MKLSRIRAWVLIRPMSVGLFEADGALHCNADLLLKALICKGEQIE